MGTPKAPQSLPWTPPGASESLENELLDIDNLQFCTPKLLKTQAKSLFLLVRGLRKSLFLAFKIAYKSMFFQHVFAICDFIIFYTTTHLFGLQLGPQLGVKNPSCFLIFVSWTEQTQWEPPKAPQSLLWTPWGPRENLENEPLENEILHFACPWPIENTNKKQNTQAFAEPLKTQTKNRTHKLLPHPPPLLAKTQILSQFLQILSLPHTVRTLLGNSTLSTEHPDFNLFPRICNTCIQSTASAHDASRSLQSTQSQFLQILSLLNTVRTLLGNSTLSTETPDCNLSQNQQYLYSIYCFCARRVSEPPQNTDKGNILLFSYPSSMTSAFHNFNAGHTSKTFM